MPVFTGEKTDEEFYRELEKLKEELKTSPLRRECQSQARELSVLRDGLLKKKCPWSRRRRYSATKIKRSVVRQPAVMADNILAFQLVGLPRSKRTMMDYKRQTVLISFV